MKRFMLLSLVAFAFPACEQATQPGKSAVSPAIQFSAAGDDYVVIDLGTLGGTTSRAFGINDRGQIVGESETADGKTHAFLWENGVMTDLGTLGDASCSLDASRATGINARGQIVGYSWCSGVPFGITQIYRAFLWEDGVMRDLGTLGGPNSAANSINNRGQVVGWAHTSEPRAHAFLWQDGVMTDLGTAPGVRFNHARGINEVGQVVGECHNADGMWPACLWDKGSVTILGPLEMAYAFAINNRGQIAGSHDDDIAVLWEKGVMSYILGTGWSNAYGINDRGQVVGVFPFPQGAHAFLWEKGVAIDLGTLGGYSVGEAINNLGQVVGLSHVSRYEFHATLWTR